MKTYEKPTLTLLSVSANDMLCTGCGIIYDDKAFSKWWSDFEYGGSYTQAFDDNSCEINIGTDFEGYCKFAGPDNMQLFTS